MSNSKQDTKELFENIAKFVDDSRNLLKQGANAEMAGMDKKCKSCALAFCKFPMLSAKNMPICCKA